MAQLDAACNTYTVSVMLREEFMSLVADVLSYTPTEDIQTEVSRRVESQTRRRESQLWTKNSTSSAILSSTKTTEHSHYDEGATQKRAHPSAKGIGHKVTRESQTTAAFLEMHIFHVHKKGDRGHRTWKGNFGGPERTQDTIRRFWKGIL
ncbi:hypothetical protein K458DRAFT_381253 [Lentithecium fluviatile CBS 122367]|uniref:Uncharacterized protein n=1 Tax=Lentithecium fluviatile CBS 122367 TaxID=1168545 RepID=A0A6G1JME3_9PLEO|nr:hypothetical protein K458DRAFT_381253 [Lentithecium fluviatile CBS 122367]